MDTSMAKEVKPEVTRSLPEIHRYPLPGFLISWKHMVKKLNADARTGLVAIVVEDSSTGESKMFEGELRRLRLTGGKLYMKSPELRIMPVEIETILRPILFGDGLISFSASCARYSIASAKWE